MKVKMLVTRVGHTSLMEGNVYDLPDVEARRLIEAGKATLAESVSSQKKVETTMEPPSPARKKAASRGKKKHAQ